MDWNIIHRAEFLTSLKIRNPHDRDDAIQDAYIKLVGKETSLPLFYRATQNSAKDLIKAERRRKTRESIQSVRSFQNRGTVDPTARAERREMRAAIKRMFRAAGLSPDYRCALRAWMRNELAGWAARKGVNKNTARTWVNRGIVMLKPFSAEVGLGPH